MAINGSFWIGGCAGCGGVDLFAPIRRISAPTWAGASPSFIGALLALGILALRTFIPESPRWLVIHGHEKEAETITGQIEAEFADRKIALSDPNSLKPLRIKPKKPYAAQLRSLARSL